LGLEDEFVRVIVRPVTGYRSVRSSFSSNRVVFSVTLGGVTNSAVFGRARQLLGERAGGCGSACCCMGGLNCGWAQGGGPYILIGLGAPSSNSPA